MPRFAAALTILCLTGCPRPTAVPPAGARPEPSPTPAAPAPAPAQDDAPTPGDAVGDLGAPPSAGGEIPAWFIDPPTARPAKPASERVCEAREREVREHLAAIDGPCESDADCQLRQGPCPFGCYIATARAADTRAAQAAMRRYFEACPPCKYKCAKQPTHPTCESGHCRVPD